MPIFSVYHFVRNLRTLIVDYSNKTVYQTSMLHFSPVLTPLSVYKERTYEKNGWTSITELQVRMPDRDLSRIRRKTSWVKICFVLLIVLLHAGSWCPKSKCTVKPITLTDRARSCRAAFMLHTQTESLVTRRVTNLYLTIFTPHWVVFRHHFDTLTLSK